MYSSIFGDSSRMKLVSKVVTCSTYSLGTIAQKFRLLKHKPDIILDYKTTKGTIYTMNHMPSTFSDLRNNNNGCLVL